MKEYMCVYIYLMKSRFINTVHTELWFKVLPRLNSGSITRVLIWMLTVFSYFLTDYLNSVMIIH